MAVVTENLLPGDFPLLIGFAIGDLDIELEIVGGNMNLPVHRLGLPRLDEEFTGVAQFPESLIVGGGIG